MRLPTRTPGLSPSEIATILIAYHHSRYKCFEYYYKECIPGSFHGCFPQAPCYERFVPFEARTFPLLFLILLLKTSQSIRTGYYFIDSKKLEVGHICRGKSYKVFKEFARKGKSSMGWFYGLKVHLVINQVGQIVSFLFTPGSTADNHQKVLLQLLEGLQGKCCGDKGYVTTLFEHFYTLGLRLVVRPKKKTKSLSLPILQQEVQLLKQQAVIESVNDILTTVCNLEHSRHPNPLQGIANMLSALIAYQFMPAKPHIFIPGALNYLQAA